MKNKILNIGSGYYQSSIVKEIKKMGYEIISCDIDLNAPGLKYADKKIIVDCHNHIKTFNKIKKYKNEIIAVVSGSARNSIYTTAYIANKLNLNCLNPKIAKQVIDKKYISKKFNHHLFIPINKLNKIYKNKKVEKIVIKANSLSGQMGVGVFKNFKNNKKIVQFCNRFNKNELCCEKFIKGHHFIVTGISHKKKYKFYITLLKEVDINLKTVSITTNSKLIENFQAKLIRFCKFILKGLKFDNGPFQLEIFMDTKKKMYVGEIEPSIPGSYISKKIIPYSTGRNFIQDCVKCSIDENYRLSDIKKIRDVKLIFNSNKIKKTFSKYEKLKYAYIRKSNIFKV
jgi:biotin carboxylase